MASELLVNKLSPQSGTTLTIGDAGDTISFASGVLPALESLTITGDLTVNTDALKVDSTNKFVGIGTASPTAELDIHADVPSIQLTDTDGTNQIGLIYENAGNLFLQSQNDTANGKITLRRYDGSTLDSTITMDSGGGLLLGTTSPGSAVKGDIVVDGNIYLGGTGAANALDDYEEGTWTPGFTFGGSSAGIVYTVQDGQYTKIGRQVTCSFDLRLSNNGTGVGNAKLTGLPFTVGNLLPNTALEGGGLVTYHTSQGTAHTSLSISPDDGSTEAFMYVDLVTQATNAYIGNSCNMRGVFTYFIA